MGYCFYYDGTYICARGKILVQWLMEQMKLEETPPLLKVIKQLKYHGLLKIVGGENTSNLYVDGKPTYKHYFIITDRLVEIKREYNKPCYDANLFSQYLDLKKNSVRKRMISYRIKGTESVRNQDR